MPTRGESFKFLRDEGPNIFGNVGSMLYVGHRHDTDPWWHRDFAPAVGASRIAVVDIVQANLNTANHITQELYLGDVRQEDLPRGFGLVFWDEGPEHMPQEAALSTIQHLMSRNGWVLVSCPWGFQPQGKDPADPEFHHWGPQPTDFESIGMSARCFGDEFRMVDGGHVGHGNLIAWGRSPTA